MTAALLMAAAVLVWVRRSRQAAAVERRPAAAVAALVVAAVAAGVQVGAPEPAALALILAGAAWGAHGLWRQRTQALLVEGTRERVLECCDLLAAELSAGQPAEAALGRAAEAWPAIGPVAQCQAYGGDVPAHSDALPPSRAPRGWPWSRPPGTSPTAPGTAWPTRCAGSRCPCGRLARPTASCAASWRPHGLPPGSWPPCPSSLSASGPGSGGDPVGFLLGTPIGLACLAGGVGLGLAGLAWIERLAAEVGR